MDTYIGNKGGQGIKEFLLNYIPKAKRYFSLFFGGGGLEKCKQLQDINWIISEKNQDLQSFLATSAVVVYSDYRELVADFVFTADDFIFCDPPYILETRKQGRKYYKHEFDIQDHVEFLNYISCCSSKVLITHPECDLYNTLLPNWSKVPFSYMTRNGWFNDCIYLNFDISSVELYTYDFLGLNRTERQQIKRKRKNFISKFKNMSFHERKAVLEKIDHV